MTPKVSDIIGIVEAHAPLSGAESWDNSGLQIGDPSAEVKTAAVALDASEENVSHAAGHGARLLITHHPLIFPDITSVDVTTDVGKTISAAVKGDLSIYSAHTSLDHAVRGTSHALAQALSLADISTLPPEGSRRPYPEQHPAHESTPEDGILVFGRLGSPMSLTDLAAFTKEALKAPTIRLVGDGTARILIAAVCAGSGGAFIARAKAMGADILITGEVRYHSAVSAREMGLCLIEAGHFWSEMPAVRTTARIITEEATQRRWDLSVFVIEGRDPYMYR